MQAGKNRCDGRRLILFVLLMMSGTALRAQPVISLAAIDGIDLTPSNILGFQLQSSANAPLPVSVQGTVRFRNSAQRFSYTFQATLQPGINSFSAAVVKPAWQFSSQALRELFMDYAVLPQGTYEYCVTVTPKYAGGENIPGDIAEECLFRQAEDLFMINLIDPEDDAKIYEYNPLLSWVVNYPFVNALTYRVRVAPIRKGQNTANALQRNNPVYDEKNLTATSVVYPVYAKPLELWQPYAWTVDAYYKGLLLGGAAPWRFTIVEDSLLMSSIPREISYLDLRLEKKPSETFALGKLKLKYELSGYKSDTLFLKLMKGNTEIQLTDAKVIARQGDNRYDIDFTDKPRLQHLKQYSLEISNKAGERFIVLFRFVNPDFL